MALLQKECWTHTCYSAVLRVQICRRIAHVKHAGSKPHAHRSPNAFSTISRCRDSGYTLRNERPMMHCVTRRLVTTRVYFLFRRPGVETKKSFLLFLPRLLTAVIQCLLWQTASMMHWLQLNGVRSCNQQSDSWFGIVPQHRCECGQSRCQPLKSPSPHSRRYRWSRSTWMTDERRLYLDETTESRRRQYRDTP